MSTADTNCFVHCGLRQDTRTRQFATPQPRLSFFFSHTKIIYYSCAAVSVRCAWHANNLEWWTPYKWKCFFVCAKNVLSPIPFGRATTGWMICYSLLVVMHARICTHSDQPMCCQIDWQCAGIVDVNSIPFSATLQMVWKNQPYECERMSTVQAHRNRIANHGDRRDWKKAWVETRRIILWHRNMVFLFTTFYAVKWMRACTLYTVRVSMNSMAD